ncbi:Maf family nucleotide pyrophosphatase [Niveibacterium sp. 24ML]|uniref:Maf family protein n=1 Tax=Niveibacterium sp. 24ML TaxID=2985512 RepID=UPI00227050AC|nr:Maf family protein [Niveibacterium sp. 24ML]MCX9154720.1 Maf family nucleotide pyrophosphatase [Niveibacterium sp. 24ML]
MLPPRIYLASRSPRRRELLHQIGIAFDTLLFRAPPREDADVNEDVLPGEEPVDYVVRVARAKAQGGWTRLAWRSLVPHPVLSADTTIDLDGEIIGKPVDTADAAAILHRLAGRTHRVLTAIAMADGQRIEHLLSVSEVRFGELSEEQIQRYIATGEPMDKAGAYGIQGRAGAFVAEIRGSYTGIVGLPLHDTAQLLRSFDYPV